MLLFMSVDFLMMFDCHPVPLKKLMYVVADLHMIVLFIKSISDTDNTFHLLINTAFLN